MFNLVPQTAPEITKCKVCGRPLRDPISIRYGAGPTCRGGCQNKSEHHEDKQLSIEWEKQRPETVICMNTGDGWIAFSTEGLQIASGKTDVDLATNILWMITEPDEAMAKAFAEVIKGATRGVVRQTVIEKFIGNWRAKDGL